MDIRMINLNKVMLSGRLAADPEILRFANGGEMLKFTIANSIPYKVDNEFKEMVAFIPTQYSGKLLDMYQERLHKGTPVFVEGSIAETRWTDKETGKGRSRLYLKIYKLQILEKHSQPIETAQDTQESYSRYNVDPQQNPAAADDDDLPF